MNYSDITVNTSQTQYLYKGKPLFSHAFLNALNFHKEGLAAVLDESGAYHINMKGEAIYRERYDRTFGYYYEKAGVINKKGAFHIDIHGKPIYNQCYIWVGNYQQNVCTVRDLDDFYFHIDEKGNSLYDEKYMYAGDFRDGIACVQLVNGKFTHIYKDGSKVHNRYFFDLNVYHKGFACAKDEKGWHHIDIHGKEIYKHRFLMIEPFYNGLALVTDFEGEKGVIDEEGNFLK